MQPSESFVRLLASQVYSGKVTVKVLEQFTNLTKKSINQYVSDVITDRLKSALTKETEQELEKTTEVQVGITDNKIITTVEEMEAFYIVKAILRQKIDGNRVFFRDAQSYFTIMVDDNNRKTVCRFYFGEKRKYIGTFDEQKKEIKTEILQLDDIYNFASQLLVTAENYDKVRENV